MDLSINNVINITVSEQGLGLGKYNTSNLAVFSRELYDRVNFGDKGFKIYLDATEVLKDFGSASMTYAMASAVFSQTKNILAGGGYFVVMPYIAPSQSIVYDLLPASGNFDLEYGLDSVNILFDDTTDVEALQVKVRELDGLENARVIVSDDLLTITIFFDGFTESPTALAFSSNTLEDAAGPTAVVITIAELTDLESLTEAITRTDNLVQYFGVMDAEITADAEITLAATLIQTMRKIYFPVSNLIASIEAGGIFGLTQIAGLNQTRCLYYGTGEIVDSLKMVAAYASRALSTNFDGINTTQTMHLKDLKGVLPDETISQGDIETCKVTGVDLYASIQGVAKVYSSGGNTFFDRIYNKLWFVGRLAIDGFNILAKTSTKVPQTEDGVLVLSGAYRKVCEQAIVNSFVAAGEWTSPDTFGNLEDFRANILERGYYIYTAPVALQSALDREARKAPIAQIAIKEAGAIHSADLIININA